MDSSCELKWIRTEVPLDEKYDVHRGLRVYITKPHVVNRRICDSKYLQSFNVVVNCESDDFRNIKHYVDDVIDKVISDKYGKRLSVENILSVFSNANVTCQENSFESDIEIQDIVSNISDNCAVIVHQQFVPKLTRENLRQIVILSQKSAIFIPLEEININSSIAPNFIYKLEHVESRLILSVQHKDIKNASFVWLKNKVIPKIVSWSTDTNVQSVSYSVKSLSLVDAERYNEVYQTLKKKYGRKLTEMWPESTDPQKYVYEDIAIAAYLLVIWEEERKSNNLILKQSFVDVGCGNGLLVYLLTCEGHKGIGLDVRCRKVWNMYQPKPDLKESSIIPSDKDLFPDYDWLIGNHSDELTPWIPVMASRSSFHTKYFVLPCCLHDFTGKYQRRKKCGTLYRSYLDYVKNIGEICGFRVMEDKLRIPSTKRICFVGCDRTYSQNEQEKIESNMQEFIHTRSGICIANDIVNDQVLSFKPRPRTEVTRNCTKTDRAVVNEVVEKIFSELLQLTPDNDGWNCGGEMSLGNAVELFDQSILKHLKNECGGLQTLLKNHNQIFKVRRGKVSVKKPQLMTSPEEKIRKFHKSKLCWFNENHPNGCLLKANECQFAHGANDLRKISFLDLKKN